MRDYNESFLEFFIKKLFLLIIKTFRKLTLVLTIFRFIVDCR